MLGLYLKELATELQQTQQYTLVNSTNIVSTQNLTSIEHPSCSGAKVVKCNDTSGITRQDLSSMTDEECKLTVNKILYNIYQDENGNYDDPHPTLKLTASGILGNQYSLLKVYNTHKDDVPLLLDNVLIVGSYEELLYLLSEVVIRFDNNPSLYTKQDFFSLIRALLLTLPAMYQDQQVTVHDFYLNSKLVSPVDRGIHVSILPGHDFIKIVQDPDDSGKVIVSLNIGEMSTITSGDEYKISSVADTRNYITDALTWHRI